MIKLSQLKLIYDFQCSTLPDDLMSLFQLSGDVRSYSFLNSVVNKLLYIPPFKTITYGSHSLRYQGPKLWNETFKKGNIMVDTNKDIKLNQIKTTHQLKNALKRHFFYKYSIDD